MIKAAQMKIYDDAVTLIYSLLKCFFLRLLSTSSSTLKDSNRPTRLRCLKYLQTFNSAVLRKASQWLSHVGSTFSQLISIVKAHRVRIVLVWEPASELLTQLAWVWCILSLSFIKYSCNATYYFGLQCT